MPPVSALPECCSMPPHLRNRLPRCSEQAFGLNTHSREALTTGVSPLSTRPPGSQNPQPANSCTCSSATRTQGHEGSQWTGGCEPRRLSHTKEVSSTYQQKPAVRATAAHNQAERMQGVGGVVLHRAQLGGSVRVMDVHLRQRERETRGHKACYSRKRREMTG
jgi:hypothetical protein